MYVVAHVAMQEFYVMFTNRCGLCDHTPTRVGQMGQAIWAGPYGPAKYYGLFRYACSCHICYGDS